MSNGAAGFLMIRSIDVRNFRCFKHLIINSCHRFNVIVGDNGAGKTALVEAIFLALGSHPSLGLRYRQMRGLDSQFGGTINAIEDAMWRDLFYMQDWDTPMT